MNLMRQHAHYVRNLDLRARKRIGHPASPTDTGDGWTFTCQLPGCTQQFMSPVKQRRYCTDEHRNEASRQARRRRLAITELHSLRCGWHRCTNRFVPRRSTQQFCSKRCAQRNRRYAAAALAPRRCHWCQRVLPESAPETQLYCRPAHRTAAYRARKANQ